MKHCCVFMGRILYDAQQSCMWMSSVILTTKCSLPQRTGRSSLMDAYEGVRICSTARLRRNSKQVKILTRMRWNAPSRQTIQDYRLSSPTTRPWCKFLPSFTVTTGTKKYSEGEKQPILYSVICPRTRHIECQKHLTDG